MVSGFIRSLLETSRLYIGFDERILCRWGREIKVDSGAFGHAEILAGAGALYLVEGLTEHDLVGFLAVEQENVGFPHFLSSICR